MPEVEVEIVFAVPEKQLLQILIVESGATVADVIALSGVQKTFPDYRLDRMAVGIWGCEVDRDRAVKAGDRIEIYRPLKLDPREARRRLALSGRTMGNAESG